MNSAILRNLRYIIFYVKKDISEDFRICISVRLRELSFGTLLGICFCNALLLSLSMFFSYSKRFFFLLLLEDMSIDNNKKSGTFLYSTCLSLQNVDSKQAQLVTIKVYSDSPQWCIQNPVKHLLQSFFLIYFRKKKSIIDF